MKQSNATLWTGRAISGLVVLFLLMDGAMKLVKPAPVVEATTKLGLPESTIALIGLVLLACTALYAFRRTAPLGALLLTGYLGGASAINLRAGTPLFNVLFPVAFGALAWGGLALRDSQLRALLGVPEEQGAAASGDTVYSV